MSASVPDRRGETWEEVPRPEHKWAPEIHLVRFVVVDEPRLLEGRSCDKADSWWHPVLWIDDCGPSAETDPDENGMNESFFRNGMYVRLG